MSKGDQPANTDFAAETAMIAAVLHHSIEAILLADDISLSPSDFFRSTNIDIYSVMKEYLDENPTNKIDKHVIVSRLNADGRTKTAKLIEENDYLETIMESKVSVDSVPTLAMNIKKNSIFRAVLYNIEELRDDIEGRLKPGLELSDLLCVLDSKVGLITEELSNPNDRFETFGEGAEAYVNNLIENPCKFAGIQTGYPLYDYAVGRGLRRGSIHVVGARTGVGKSIWGMNVGDNIVKKKIPVLYIDTELMKEHQYSRLFANLTDIRIGEIEESEFINNPVHKEKILKESKNETLNLYYHKYVGGWKIEQILAYIKKWIRQVVGLDENGVRKDCLIIYDYLKLMNIEGMSDMKEYAILGFAMNSLHNLMMREDVPMMLMIQLNRDGINADGTHTLSGSDRIGWIGGSVGILKEKTQEELAESGAAGNMKIIIVKSRFGAGTPQGDWINFNGDRARATFTETELQSVVRANRAAQNNNNDDREEENDDVFGD